ncbi:MAG TPA: zinc dependent phospholipase C family protein [Phototrophicaceae bacterium]|jgi:hypothetical protein|nr:zinc dependent phospholipase C family protein [Phototrophicaceae bacterium]
MPLPMVHLAVAVQLAAQHAQFPSPAFLLGSIAPDAIHMRQDAGYDDKQRTHLDQLADTDHRQLQTLLAERLMLPDSEAAFAAGYAAHLLTDRLWLQQVTPAFGLQVDGLDPAERRKVYYTDTDQVDFNLYHRSGWRSEVWQGLTVANALDFPPLLSGGEIDGWRVRTLRWFEDGSHEPGVTPRYLTDALVRDFIEQATAYVGMYFTAWQIDHHYL